jgi:excisionase family DNA binding protein
MIESNGISPNLHATLRTAQSLQRLVTELAERVDLLTDELAAVTAPPAATPAALLTVEQAADQLGISRSRVFTLVRDGRLRSVKLGASRRIPRAAIDELVEGLANCQTAA